MKRQTYCAFMRQITNYLKPKNEEHPPFFALKQKSDTTNNGRLSFFL